MKNNRFPVVTVILYVLAFLLLAYAVWATVYSAGIVNEAITMGQLVVAGNEFEVVSFYMNNIALYFLFAVVLFGLGWVLQTISFQETISFDVESDNVLFDESSTIDEEFTEGE